MKRGILAGVLIWCTAILFATEETTTQGGEDWSKKKEEQRQEITGGRVYLKLGGALLFDERRVIPEPTFGFGYRYEEGMLAVDLSFFNESIGPTVKYTDYGTDIPYERNKLRITLTRWANLSFLWLAEPAAWNSFYAGGGLAVETIDLELADDISSRTGIAGTLMVGWEFMRDRKIVIFVQLETVLPCYAGRFNGDTFWVPSLTLTVGAGF